ncbi:transposase [Tranquillimonas rosea]|uniref:transposase n=1 Tax=Tranquillimonas rosea TaxID=641238 RepID=UPI003BA92888
MERDGKVGVHLGGSTCGGVSRLEVIEGPTGRRRRTKAERARIAAESLVPGVKVADVARRHGTTRWQAYDWRKKLRSGQLTVPESVTGLPMFAELLAEDPAEEAPASGDAPALEIVAVDVVIRVVTGTDEGLLAHAR